MAVEGTAIPGEEDSSALNPEIQEQKVKETASKKGWTPLKEWTGPAEDWVSAKEFLGREKLFKKIHDLQYTLGQQSKKHEADFKQIQDHFAKVRETEYKRAQDDLKAARKEAIAAGDAQEAERIDNNLEALRAEAAKVKEQEAAQAKATQAQQQGPTKVFTEWKEKNSWFEQDTDMTQMALEIGTSHAAANQNKSQEDVLAYVEKRIRQAYPEKFQSQTRRGSPVEGGGSLRMSDGGTKGSKTKLAVSDLDDTEKHVLNTLLKTKTLKVLADKNKVTETQQYLNDLAEAKGLR